MQRNEAVAAAINESRADIMAFLTQLVNCNSYVWDRDAVGRVAEMIVEAMPGSFTHEAIAADCFADHHRFSHVTDSSLPVVLAGHMDTLCPPEGRFQRLTEQGDKLLGPGVSDMKGGLTVLIWALKVLERCGLLNGMSLVCIFNGDEEVGSPTSGELFTAMKGKASRALVFEAGGPGGTVVTTRKGVARYRLDIRGKAAHFGCLQGDKTSAVEELAHKIQGVESLNAEDSSLVANVGKVEGGLAANKVAETAVMEFEVRYWDAAVGAKAAEGIEDLAQRPSVPGCDLALSRLSYRPPLQPSSESRAFFDLACKVAQSLGGTIIEEKRGGVSDANWLAYAGIPTLDGLGPIGDLDFTEDEYILKETLFQRIEIAAHLLLALQA